MMLQLADVNAFSACHNLNLAESGDTLFDWQWRMMRYMSPPLPKPVSPRCHAPLPVEPRNNCARCSKRTHWKWQQCKGVQLHLECFEAYNPA